MDVFLCAKRSGSKILVWSVETLIAEATDLPINYRQMEDFSLEKMNFFASYEDANLKSFVEHMSRVELADVSVPLILAADGSILDGMHRLAKASKLGISKVAVVQFTVDPEPLRVIELLDSGDEPSKKVLAGRERDWS
ncbi:ParB N-terminal domain-containing protein [Bradyrhizobium liaoningense]|uniref:hypothetical protein n=1 Tax=Bradyrhizobium liaoningense TaxID=43992 RepID=UPI000684031D|nr:hypothetical protein [Bradyrhizobium liaoningense]